MLSKSPSLKLVPFVFALLVLSCTISGNIDLAQSNSTPLQTESASTPPPTVPPQLIQTSPGLTPSPEQNVGATQPSIVSPPTSIYLVLIDDNGQNGKKIGCNDSVVPVSVMIPEGSDPKYSAIEQLLSMKEQHIGDYYNAIYQSDLAVTSLNADSQGNVSLALDGQILLGGVCDNPRFLAQIEETLRQFPDVQNVSVTIGGVPLEQLLSEK
jgi:hypothetical protein